MNSVSLGSSFTPLSPPPLCKSHPNLLQLKHQQVHHHLCFSSFNPPSISLKSKPTKSVPTLLRATDSETDDPVSFPEEGTASVVHIEEVIEKDWSLLDSAEGVEFKRSIDRILASGKVEEGSRVLVSTGSEEFVDCLVGLCKSLFVVHDSLLILACIKEKYDKVKCWQGEIIYVPDKWAPLDVVFLYFLPALPFKLDDVLGSLAKKCSQGGRVIISHPQGRQVLEQQQQQYPDIVVSEMPDKTNLQRVAEAHSFDIAEFVDEPGLYLAVLIYSRA